MSRLSDARQRFRHLVDRIGPLRKARKELGERLRQNKEARREKRELRDHLRKRLAELKAVPSPDASRLDRINEVEVRLWAVDTRIAKLTQAIHKQARKLNRVREALDRLTKRKRHVHHKIEYLKAHHEPPAPSTGFTWIDGRLVPNWMVPWVYEIRRRGWGGTIVSGYRTPEYSTSLCMNICGAPTCPGRCAGASSNHSAPPTHTGVAFEGAIDVSDYYTFGSLAREIGAPFHNGLPTTDPVHFSHAGN